MRYRLQTITTVRSDLVIDYDGPDVEDFLNSAPEDLQTADEFACWLENNGCSVQQKDDKSDLDFGGLYDAV